MQALSISVTASSDFGLDGLYIDGIRRIIIKQQNNMKQVVSTLKFFALVTICICIGTTCVSDNKKPAEVKASVEESEQKEADGSDLQLMAEAAAFLKTFYQEFEQAFDEGGDYDECLRQHVTPKAEQWFKDMYDYDCEDDNCMASWLLLYDITDPGTLQERTIEAIDGNTCKVMMTYDRGNGEMYEYILKVGIVKEGNEFKIDDVEIEGSRTYEP